MENNQSTYKQIFHKFTNDYGPNVVVFGGSQWIQK